MTEGWSDFAQVAEFGFIVQERYQWIKWCFSLFFSLQCSTKSICRKTPLSDIFNLQSTWTNHLSEYPPEDYADTMKWHFTILEKSDTRMKNPKVTITKQYSSKSSCIEKVLTWRHLCKSRKGVEFPVCDDTDGTDLSIFRNLWALAAGWCFCW